MLHIINSYLYGCLVINVVKKRNTVLETYFNNSGSLASIGRLHNCTKLKCLKIAFKLSVGIEFKEMESAMF